jgi:hypothetical protein
VAKVGAPTKFSDDKEEMIIRTIADGGTLADAGKAAKVDPSTIKRWLEDESREEFRAKYRRAREDQADSFADEIVEVARDSKRDPSQARVQIDALKWAAGKRKPKVYGDKIHNEHTGPDGGSIPVSVAITRVFVTPKRSE